MGCDIHLYVEKKVDGKWVSADVWERVEAGDMCVPYRKEYYQDRNYALFSILANVRNGVGFAGVDTGDGFVPIAEPKGLPEDVCENVKQLSDNWGEDGHSHSWHALRQLLDYDWTQVSTLRGWVNGPEFIKWCSYKRERGEGPESYSGGVSGRGIKHISVAEMEKETKLLIDVAGFEETKERLAHTYCQVEWTEAYYQAASDFWASVVPRLLQLGQPDDVRIVFWFDN